VTDVLELDDALAPDALSRVRDAMRAAAGEDAGVLGVVPGERVASSARRASRLDLPAGVRAAVGELLDRLRPRLAEHFGRELDGHEEPQFLRYVEGDYFVAHQDGNTPLIHDETRFRKVSIVLFVSGPSEYEGGSLVLHPPMAGPGEPRTVEPAGGRLVAYPAETTHEVTPIVAGERLTIVSWYRSGG
jgi:predicted 2-oxoglutarate/Fe(II)-dependent dioxygenase YbiX